MKINLIKNILKGSMDVFILKMFGAVAVFLLTLFISNSAGPAALGKFQLLSKLVLIGSIIATMGLDVFAVRKISEIGGSGKLSSIFVKRSMFSILAFSILIAAAGYVLKSWIAEKFFKSSEMEIYIVFAGITVFFYAGYSFLCQVFRGYGSVKAFAFFRYSWLHIFFIILLGMLYVVKKDFQEQYIYYLYFISTTVSFLAILYFLKRYLKKKTFPEDTNVPDKGLKNDIHKSMPMMFSNSLSFFTAYTNVFIIGYFLSTYYVGIFSGVQQFMMFFSFVSVALAAYTSPLLAKSHIKKDFKMLRSLYLHSILTSGLMLVPVFIVLAFFPGFVLEITLGDKYVPHANIMTILAVGYFINALSGPVITMMNMTDNQLKLVVFSVLNFVIGSVLTAVLTWKYSIAGAAVASCLTNIFFRLSLMLFITKNILRQSL
jgi:O-antigen/teichoic acid export membrane protein